MSGSGESISVALCTCNGEPYLAEQLASIASQHRLPDELVIRDDASTDATVEIIRRFVRSTPMPVRLTVNPERLGVGQNFGRAIADCRGQIIVLADQDDLWLPHKTARLAQTLTEWPDAGLVFGNATLIDATGRPLGRDLWQSVGFGPSERRRMIAGRELDVLLRHNVVTGATMAFRAKWRDLILPIGPGWIHDAWIALLVAAVARLALVAEPLTRYRQHAGQQIGERKRSIHQEYLRVRGRRREDFQRTADLYAAAASRLAESKTPLRDRLVIDAIGQKCEHFHAKSQMRASLAQRLRLILGELQRGRYRRYSLGWKSLAQDLFL